MKDKKRIYLNEEFFISTSFSQLKTLCKNKGIKIKRLGIGRIVFKLGNIFGLKDLNVYVPSFLNKIFWFEIYRDATQYRKGEITPTASFLEFYDRLVSVYGNPTRETGMVEDYTMHCEWELNGVKILLYLFERFGSEDHLRVELIDVK